MALYEVDTVAGVDTNSGVIGSPWKTIARVCAASGPTPYSAGGDVHLFKGGIYPLTAALTSTVPMTWIAYPGQTPEITGAFDLNLNSTTYTSIYGFKFGAGNGSNAKVVFGGNGNKTTLQKCIFQETTQTTTKQAIRTTTTSSGGTNLILKDCEFKIATNSSTPALISNNSTGTIFVSMENCKVNNYTNLFGGGSSTRITGKFNGNSFCNLPYIIGGFDNTSTGQLIFENNSFVGCTDFIRNNSSSSFSIMNIHLIKNAMLFTGKIVNNLSTGVYSLDSVLNDHNCFLSTTDITNTTMTNTSTIANVAAAQFYNTTFGSEDLRVKILSPLLAYPIYIGALPPEWDPTVWCERPAASYVSTAAPPWRWLTNGAPNESGTLSAGGETDGNKVLTTSTLITGTINPNTVMASNVNGTLPLSAVKASNGGTLPLNKIAPSQGGTYLGQESNSTLLASQLKLGETITNLGNIINGTYDPITGNWEPVAASDLRAGRSKKQNGILVNGLLDLPLETHVKALVVYDNGTKTGNRTDASTSNVLTGSGTYGANGTELTPSYSPDFPSRSNVAPDDTVDGLSGTMDLPALNRVSPNATLRGQTGTQDLPALNKVAPSDTLEGNSGTMDLPSLNKVAPSDTLEGVSGTMDLPALNRVSPNDTLEGVQGTQDLPSLSSILTTDTLEGASGTADVNALANLPATNKVLLGTDYGLNLEFTGTAIELDLTKFTDLNSSDVRDGVQYKYNSSTNNRNGGYMFDLSNYTQLIPAEVKYGKVYLYGGVSYTGTLGQPPVVSGDNVLSALTGMIEDKITLFLPTHKPLQYVNEIEKNTWKGNQKRYGVLVKDGNEIRGPIGHNSISQDFEIILTDGYMNKPLSDGLQRSKALALQDISHTIYKELSKNSLIYTATAFNVKDFKMSSPEYIESDNVCIVRMSVSIMYRQKL